MMSSIADFFGCFGNGLKEKQVTVAIQERRPRASSSRTARIKRSVSKSPKFDNGQKVSSNHTYLTLTCYSKSSKAIDKRSKDIDSSSSFDHSFQGRSQMNQSFTPSKETSNQLSTMTTSQKISKFINYNDYNNYCNSYVPNADLLGQKDVKNFNLNAGIQIPVIKTNNPRLLLDRRFRKGREQQGISTAITSHHEDERSSSFTAHRKQPLVHTVLQPIEERLSMPSCSQSQIHDLNPNPSFAQLTRIHYSAKRMPQSSPLSQRFGSCTFERDMNQNPPGLAMTQSESMKSFEEKLSHHHNELIGNKVRIDNEIYRRQLKSLNDQQKVLRQQSLCSKQIFKQTIDKLQETKKKVMLEMKHQENSLKQAVKMLGEKEDDHKKGAEQQRDEMRN